MADSQINGLTPAAKTPLDKDDLLVTQLDGQTLAKGAKVSEVLGGWVDLAPYQYEIGSGANKPSFAQVQGNDYSWQFSVGHEMWLFYHINHNILPAAIVPGTKMYLHAHWQTNGINTGAPRWQIDYTMAAGHNTANYPAMNQFFLQEAAQGSAYRHMTTEDTVGVATPEVDTLIRVHIKRVASTGTENTDAVFLDAVDWHIPVMAHATKNRLPNFRV